MKMIVFFVTISLLQVTANVSSQNVFLNNKENLPLEDVFEEIEVQTNYRFAYRESFVDGKEYVTIPDGKITVDEFLDKILKTKGYNYVILSENLVVIAGKEENLLQQIAIKGKVVDETGVPIPGANVLEKGTNNGTVTDLEGFYSITVSGKEAILQYSFIGFYTKEVEVGDQIEINITLNQDNQTLNEVVVVGFGQRKKRDLTGSIASVQAVELEQAKSISPQFALQGNAAGVRIVNTSGDPNEAPDIFIRGIGTWNGDAQPLYVIDGQIIEPPRAGNEDVISGFGLATPPNLFNLINPTDIESISVLKDASAAAIYGNRGANGVVLITTKKGKQGKPKVELNSSFSVRNIPTYDVLNTQQFVDLTEEMFTNNLNPDITIEDELFGGDQDSDINRLVNRSPQFDPSSPFYISDRTFYDWQDEIVVKNAFSQTYDLKVSGATEKVDYYLSGSYLDQENMFKGNDLKRYTAAMNVNSKVTDWLRIGLNYKFTHQQSVLSMTRNLSDIADVAPWQPIYDPSNKHGYQVVLDPFYGGSETWQRAKLFGQGTNQNYLATSNLNYGDFTINRNIGQAYFELMPLKGLSLRGSLNLDYSKQDRFQLSAFSESFIFHPSRSDPREEAPDAPNSLGKIGHRINNIFNYQSDFTATYVKSVNNLHNLNLTAAVQDQRHEKEWVDLSGANLTSLADNPKRNGYGNDLANNSSIYGWDRRYWFGMVGRASYNYDSKYYLDLSARRDASLGFDDDYRWGNFYSVSGAWRISSETFMENLSFISDLKLRGGWGQAGNDQAVVGSYAFLSGVSSSLSSVRFGSGNGDPLGVQLLGSVVADLPNPALTWEVVTTTYGGFDAFILENRLNVTFEYYKRVTDGIIMGVVLPRSSGLNNPSDNIGELTNKGFDIQLGWNDKIGEFTYSVSGNISKISNEVTKVFEGRPLQSSGFGRVEEGRSLGLIWGYKVGGIFQSQSEIDAFYEATPDNNISNTDFVAPGDMYFQDIGGDPTDDEPFYSKTPDGKINSYDQTEIGNTIPGYTYGLNINLGWKGFDIFAGFYGEGDVDKYNYARARFESMSGPGANYFSTTTDRWTPQNIGSDMPRAVVGDPAANNRFSDRYVENAAFFRLNNWQFGYTIPKTLLNRIPNTISSLRFYIGGQNNIYLSKWSTLDPVNDNYPLPRSFMFGINAKF